MTKLIKSISAVLVVALIISLLPINAIRASAYTRGTIDNPTNDYPRYKLKPEKVGKPKKLVFNFNYDSFNLKFKDVPADHPYRKEIVWAVKNGIFKNEAINFKPDDQMTMRELCQMGYELRWKYQQESDKKIMKDYNNRALRYGILDYKTINPTIPEFRFIKARNFGFGILSSKTIESRPDGDTYFTNFYYKPDVKVNGLVFMSFLGGALDEGGICRGKLREIHKKSEEDWDRYLNVMFYLRNRNRCTYLKHLPKGYDIKNTLSEKIDDVSNKRSTDDIADGILALYLIDFWKDLPSDEEVEEFFGKKITKGEIVSIIYDTALVGYTKYDKKEGPVDLRISHYK